MSAPCGVATTTPDAATQRLDAELGRAESLAALCVHLEATRAVFARHDIASGLRLLAQAQELASAALHENEHLLRTSYGVDRVVDTDLEAIVQSYRSRHHHTPTALTVEGMTLPLNSDAAHLLGSAARLALALLAARSATAVEVTLRYETDLVTIIVSGELPPNDAMKAGGLDSSATPEHSRLSHLCQHTAQVGGKMAHRVDHGSWTLTVSVPANT